MEKVLEINNLTKIYGKKTVVDKLSFTVEKGNIYGLLGPNGSGKSTTLGMILNVINSSQGSWLWFGQKHSIDSLQKVGAIIERPNFYPYLTAEKNLEIVANIKSVNKEKIDEKLEVVGLLERKKDKYATFSLGMKQRLAIASALLNDPSVLILDEPTNGLDPQGIIQIREIILEIAAQGTTIILSSHLLDEVEKVCSHVVILEKGKTLYCGPVDEMTNSFGYFELNSSDNSILFEMLLTLNYFEKVVINGKILKGILKEDLSAENLNRILFEKGITLSHLVKRKESLENQFLQITQK